MGILREEQDDPSKPVAGKKETKKEPKTEPPKIEQPKPVKRPAAKPKSGKFMLRMNFF